MKHQEHSTALPASVRAEAAAWVAQMHSSSRTPELEAGMRRWLQAHPSHARALEVATEAWEMAGSLCGYVAPRLAEAADSFVATPFPRRMTPSRLAIAASLLLAVMSIFVYLQQRPQLIATAIGEQRAITMRDGSRIFLNTDTRLYVDESGKERRVQLERGEAWFDVAVDHARPFVVTAGDEQVVALGTDFVVHREAQQLAVTLVEGKVRVSSTSASNKPAQVLAPGQRLVFEGDKPPQLDEPSINELTAWRRGEVIFDKTRLQDAVMEMNRYSTVKLIVDDPQAADIRLSGIFRVGDSARFAQAVGVNYRLTVAHEGGNIRISGIQDNK